MALAARVMRTFEQGRIPRDGVLAVPKLVPKNEAKARRHIEDLEGAAPTAPGDRPPKASWRALWKIHRVCGFDIPCPGTRSCREHRIVHTASRTELVGGCDANWWLSSEEGEGGEKQLWTAAAPGLPLPALTSKRAQRQGIGNRRSPPRAYVGAWGVQ
jgi:hypothetical protein